MSKHEPDLPELTDKQRRGVEKLFEGYKPSDRPSVLPLNEGTRLRSGYSDLLATPPKLGENRNGQNTIDGDVLNRDIEIKNNQPHRCPVCGGNGLVPNGFYRQTSGTWTTSDVTPETCRSCNGTGLVWG